MRTVGVQSQELTPLGRIGLGAMLLLVSTLALAGGGDVKHATYYCSTTDTTSGNLNELVFQGTKINYVESKMLADPTDVTDWHICFINGNLNSSTCQAYGEGEFTVGPILDDKGCGSNTTNTCDGGDYLHPLNEYVSWPTSVTGSEGEIILFDADPASSSAGVIDYLHYCLDTACTSNQLTILDNPTDQKVALGTGQDPSITTTMCGNVVDIPYTKGEMDSGGAAVIARLNDGTGEWLNSGDPDSPLYAVDSGSEGSTNTDLGGAGADHFAIGHDGTGINCEAESIAITAHDGAHTTVTGYTGTITLSTSTGNGDWSLVSGNGAVDNGTADDGAATYTFDAADGGTVVLGLSDTYAETVNISLSDGSAAESSTEDSDLIFTAAGFSFVADGVADGIGTQVGGKWSDTAPGAQSIVLRAITTDPATGVCQGLFADTTDVTVKLAAECRDPSACAGRQVSVANNGNIAAVATNDDNGTVLAAAYTDVALRFGANSSAALAFTYEDVGRMQLHAHYSQSGDAIVGSSNDFVVRPFGFYVTADGNPGATDHNGTVYRAAGESFTANAVAVLWDANDDTDSDGVADGHDDADPANNADLSNNTTAPNYGQENTTEAVWLSAALVQPGGGASPGLAGTTTLSSFSGGLASGAVSWGEVGIIEIAAAVADGSYLGISNVETANITGRSGHVGRFVPDRLRVTVQPEAAVWVAEATYDAGDFVVPTIANGHLYRATTSGTTDLTEPGWPTDGGTVPDGEVTWQDWGPDESNTPDDWQAATAYAVDDIVVPTTANGHRYIATAAGTSDATEPAAWPVDGGTVTDNGVTWQDLGPAAQVADHPAWTASSTYAAGDIVVPSTVNGHRYVVTAAGTSGGIEPAAWPTSGGTVTDGGVTWQDLGAEDGFAYLGYTFGYANRPVIVIEALDTAGTPLTNYAGNFWKLAGALGNRTYTDSAGASAALSVADGGDASLQDTADYDGTGLTILPNDDFIYAKATPEAPFAAAFTLNIPAGDLTDTDGVFHDPDNNGVADGATLEGITGTELRWGRLVLEDAYGSEFHDLPVPFYAQYFKSAADGFVTNAEDNATSMAITELDLDSAAENNQTDGNIQLTAGGGTTTASIANDPFAAGEAGLTFSAPGSDGWVDVTASVPAWLRDDWDDDDGLGNGPYDDDPPTARIQFGSFRGHDRIIYWREVFR